MLTYSTKRSLLLALLVLAAPFTTLAKIAPSAEAAVPLTVGAKAPSANLVAESGEPVTLASVLGGKPTVLIFYRGGWCPYCNRHLAALQEIEPQLLGMGYQIVALSPDKVGSLNKTGAKHSLTYKLYSDRAMEASAAYGVAWQVTGETLAKYISYGVDLAPVPGEPDARWLPVPAAFVIAADGTIKFVHANADYTVRIEPEALLDAARAAAE